MFLKLGWVMILLSSDWMKRWCQFFKLIMLQSNANQLLFDTQMETILMMIQQVVLIKVSHHVEMVVESLVLCNVISHPWQ